MTSQFDELTSVLAEKGQAAVLDALIEQLRQSKSYHELFEALKMGVRRELGLPFLYSDNGDELEEPQRRQLEDGLLEACREVGVALLEDGKIREGWMYLRPVGDRELAAKLIADVEPNEDNLDELVEVCLHEGVDAARGYRLVLEQYGTCNAITTFESMMNQRPRAEQQASAALLVHHVKDELTLSLKADIARQEGGEPQETTIAALVGDRDWLFNEHSYHIDTTHLAATVRFARLVDDEETLRTALDLCDYGRRLSEQFQYQGDEPFADLYPSHALYFQALLDENVDEALAYFRTKAETVDPAEFGAVAVEVYVDLLSRLGRHSEAVAAAIDLTPDGAAPAGQAPSLLELSQQAGEFDRYLAYCQKNNDLLGFAAGLLHS